MIFSNFFNTSFCKLASAVLLAVLLSGCFNAREAASPLAATNLPAGWQEPVPVSPLPVAEQLLDLISDPGLNELVSSTLQANINLQQTALLLREQQLMLVQSEAASLPDINLNLNSQRSKGTASSNNLSLDVRWEVDVWGRLAEQDRAAAADVQAAALDLQAARDSLVAQTIQSWLDIIVRAQVIAAERQWAASLENTETVILQRYRNGLNSSSALADLEAARANTALTRSSLAARQQTQQQAYRQLSLLRGEVSDGLSVQPFELPRELPEVASPPLQLPAEVVANRPDIRKAYEQIVAANARTAVAQKALLPSFNLTASLSQSSSQLGDLLSGSPAWSLLGQLTAPLFNAGRLKAEAQVAELRAERSYLNYQQVLLNALVEVEAALGQEAALAQQEAQLQLALQHSEASLAYFQRRYQAGLADILDLLSAKQSAFSARIQLLETRQRRLSNRISLGLASGIGV